MKRTALSFSLFIIFITRPMYCKPGVQVSLTKLALLKEKDNLPKMLAHNSKLFSFTEVSLYILISTSQS